MTYEVRMKLPCCTFTAMNLTYDWFNFPKNDDFSGFWCEERRLFRLLDDRRYVANGAGAKRDGGVDCTGRGTVHLHNTTALQTQVAMIFGLDPHIAPEKVDAEIERLEKEHGVAFKDKFTKIAYAPTYKPGDTGEFSFNCEGKPPTIDHAKNANAEQVLATPYPPLR